MLVHTRQQLSILKSLGNKNITKKHISIHLTLDKNPSDLLNTNENPIYDKGVVT